MEDRVVVRQPCGVGELGARVVVQPDRTGLYLLVGAEGPPPRGYQLSPGTGVRHPDPPRLLAAWPAGRRQLAAREQQRVAGRCGRGRAGLDRLGEQHGLVGVEQPGTLLASREAQVGRGARQYLLDQRRARRGSEMRTPVCLYDQGGGAGGQGRGFARATGQFYWRRIALQVDAALELAGVRAARGEVQVSRRYQADGGTRFGKAT